MAKKQRKQRRMASTVGPRGGARPATPITQDEVRHEIDGELTDMPTLPRDDLAIAPIPGLGQAALSVPSSALARVMVVGKDEGLPLAEFRVPVERWDLDKSSGISMAVRVTGDDTDFVRAFVKVPTLDTRGGLPVHVQHWMDLPTRYVGMMVEAGLDKAPEASSETVAQWRVKGEKPRWFGSHTFERVWMAATQRTEMPEPGEKREHEGITYVTAAPAKVLAVHVKMMLEDAHLVRVEADQVELLPEWDDLVEAHDYAHDLNLPFDPLYLEFEGVGGVAPQMRVGLILSPGTDETPAMEAMAVLRGALVHRGSEMHGVTIMPFGDLYLPDFEGNTVVRTAREKILAGEDSTTFPYVPAGQLVFDARNEGSERPLVGPQVLTAAMERRRLNGVACAMNTSVLGGSDNGIIVVPYQHDLIESDDELTVGQMAAWATCIYHMGLRALAALSIMESDFTVVEDAPHGLRNPEKMLQRTGGMIAQQVYVRPVRKSVVDYGDGSGEHRNFSHRFWVRGHTKHFPIGTRVATARPDLVKPCTRSGRASCGMCRRVWTPPFIKGPEDKPIVLKSLVKKVA